MEARILDLFPEFDWIASTDLRARSLKVVARAMEEGGFGPGDLDRIPFTLLIPDCRISYRQHVRGVVGVCAAVATVFEATYGDRLRLNRDHLLAGALLHDVGKLLEYREESPGKFVKSPRGALLRHPFSGVALCHAAGIPDEVMHLVAVHAREGDLGRRTPEAWVLHYADFMNFEPLR